MVEFIEKEPYSSYDRFNGHDCKMYPTYMKKDGKEFFVFNRREPQSKNEDWLNDIRKKQLVKTDGAYFKFHGFYDSPIEMLNEIIKRKHHFTDPESTYYCSFEKDGFIDFHGNRNEVSAAFHYRIYDEELATTIQKAVEHIIREEWEKAKGGLKCN